MGEPTSLDRDTKKSRDSNGARCESALNFIAFQWYPRHSAPKMWFVESQVLRKTEVGNAPVEAKSRTQDPEGRVCARLAWNYERLYSTDNSTANVNDKLKLLKTSHCLEWNGLRKVAKVKGGSEGEGNESESVKEAASVS